ncbi:MAG: phage holin [Bacillota bacterium]
MEFKKRLRNYGLWVAVAGFIPLLAQAFGYKISEAEYMEIVNALLAILVLLGIINNPATNNSGFGDD